MKSKPGRNGIPIFGSFQELKNPIKLIRIAKQDITQTLFRCRDKLKLLFAVEKFGVLGVNATGLIQFSCLGI